MYNPQLKTFFTVIEAGSFSKAAALLYLTPSAVLHQIRELEKVLGAELFLRTSKGVSLTPAGKYLEQHGRTFIQMGDELRRGVRSAATKENTICIGTSMLEKCRLLYDLWVLFSEEEPGCEVQMVNINQERGIPDVADLVESLNSGIFWMREWQFYEICRVPFGCAVVCDHALAGRDRISFDELHGQTVHSINAGTCDTIAMLLNRLREAGAKVVINFEEGMKMFWESAFTRDVVLVPLCFHDILINMTVIPLEEEFMLPYGIFYRSLPNPAVRKFLDFIMLTYGEGNRSGIVPILS